MMKLSRTVDYALRATLQLAQRNTNIPVPCSKLAAEGDMPERFLLQILRSLVNHGVMHSTRGVEGGYTLQRPAAEISLLEVIEAIEGPLDEQQLSKTSEDVAEKNLRLALYEVAQSTRRQLDAIKLAQLLPPAA